MKKAYFIGIGGIGMSALAQMMKHDGVDVFGSDRSESPVTELLESKGVAVMIGQKAENVPEDADVVVYSDAVPVENPERARATELGIKQLSYFAMLGETSRGRRTVAVAGTHGKTTVTGMLAKILQDAGAEPTAIIGSIVKDFGSNYITGRSDLLIVEACEYRDHLLELSPKILVLNNVEWDHTDYFASLEALQETFRKAIENVPSDGFVVTNTLNPNIAPLLSSAKCKVIDYTKEPAYELNMIGEFNQENARAAATAARAVMPEIKESTISKSLETFHGTWRRFEYKGKTKNGTDVYDDYAHHPTAVKETLHALRAQAKGKVYVAFHPHLYSRTRDLLDEFASAFGDSDKVFIAPIFAAREVDDGTMSSEILAERIRTAGVDATAATFVEIEQVFQKEPTNNDVIMTMGAGDIYKVADTLVGK